MTRQPIMRRAAPAVFLDETGTTTKMALRGPQPRGQRRFRKSVRTLEDADLIAGRDATPDRPLRHLTRADGPAHF